MKKLFLVLLLCPIYVFAAPVNINQANAETISESLTGIGPKKAAAIVQYRTEHGNFKTLKELENVSGIGEKIIQANEKDILLSDDAAQQPAEQSKPAEQPKAGDVNKATKE